MKKYYETLEFSMIQKAIKNYCFSEMAKNQVDALKPYHDLDDLKLYQDDVFHAMTIIYAYGRIPLAPYEDIEEIIQKAQKGGVCYPQDFLKIIQILKNVLEIQNYLENDIEKQINTLVQEISSYQKIAAFGYMQSESVACNLQFDLQTSGKLIFSCFNIKDQADYITDADENNLIIIFSESGTYFDRIFPRAKPFKSNKKKPKICMITSDQSIEYPFIDFYIRYNSKGGYASHPYPLQLISDLICIKYSETL